MISICVNIFDESMEMVINYVAFGTTKFKQHEEECSYPQTTKVKCT